MGYEVSFNKIKLLNLALVFTHKYFWRNTLSYSTIRTSTITGHQEQTTHQSFGYIFACKDLIHCYSEIAPYM